MSSNDPLKQAALAEVNKEKSTVAAWANTNKGWLIAAGGAFVFGFILGHLV